MLWIVLTALIVPAFCAAGLTYVVRAWALRRGFVDHPAGHKQHAKPVALGGGIALMWAICLPILGGTLLAWLLHDSAAPPWLPEVVQTHLDGIASKLGSVAAIVGGALVLHVVGLFDDRRPLGPWRKFAVQIGVALFLAWPMGIRSVEALGPFLSICITVLWIVTITNAFNFLDNMDGLSAGVAAIAAAIFAVASMGTGQVFVPVFGCVIAGASAGFLFFNFAPARIFMGDAGSLVIGYFVAVLTILATFYHPAQGLTPLGVLVPLLVLAVPLYDVISVIVHRLRLGESPLRGDRRHFSHRLVRRGLSERSAVLTIYLATAATGLPAIVVPRVDWPFGILLMFQCVCVLVMIAILEQTGAKGEG